jgi:excinuclease ABC subunit B
MNFELKAKFVPTGDQPTAIAKLVRGLKNGYKQQTLLGVTGSGKTFTMANVIQEMQKPILIISHNKTLAAQLAEEFQGFFPKNAVHYFVSYYDYYQPEAYVPQSDTYIEKETSINEEIDRLRHASTNALLTRKDVIIVASVSCIYGLGNVEDYDSLKITLTKGVPLKREKFLRRLTDLQYQRNDYEFTRGCFRVRGDVVEIFPIEEKEIVYRVQFYKETIENLAKIKVLTGDFLSPHDRDLKELVIFPAKHFVTTQEKTLGAIEKIKIELAQRLLVLREDGKLLEAERLEQRTNYDLEMLQETGYCNGVENYSRYLTNRAQGEPPATLLEYFSDDFLLFIDESHMTVPQLNGMYNGDRSRKQTLVDFGFRLPSALDNRPLKFAEFEKNVNQVIYVSATPGAKEYKDSGVKTIKKMIGQVLKDQVDKKDLLLQLQVPDSAVTEQIIRPTGLLEPEIIVKKTKSQLVDLAEEIQKRVARGERILVGTLTKRLAEEVSDYLADLKTTPKIKVHYLHSEILTLERSEILRDLRLGNFDVLVGINLLREGLDLPEVSLVAILDADKEGFLRSETALIQLMGRAARHSNGSVILYADNLTGSMKRAIEEIDRRRNIQLAYNKKFKQKPIGISKAVGKGLGSGEAKEFKLGGKDILRLDDLGRSELKELKADFERQMKRAVKDWNFEEAARLRDQLKLLNRKGR